MFILPSLSGILTVLFFQTLVMPKAFARGRPKVSDDHTHSVRRPSRAAKRPQRFLEDSPLPQPRDHSPVASTSTGAGTGTGELHLLIDSLHSMQAQITRLESSVASVTNPTMGRTETAGTDASQHTDSADVSDAASTLSESHRPSRPRQRAARAGRRSKSVSSTQSGDRDRRRRCKRRRPLSPPSPSTTSGEDNSITSSSESDCDTDFEDYDRPKSSFGSVSGHTVTPKLKKKILSNQYFEMAELLPNFKSHKTEERSLKQSSDNTLRFVKARPNCNIGIAQWCEAFNMFTSISIEKAKTRGTMLKLTRSLLTYSLMIPSLYRRGYDWAAYDRHFRSDRETTKDSWTTVRHDLLLMYRGDTSSFRSSKQTTQAHRAQDNKAKSSDKNGSQQIPKGYCYAFHTQGRWCERPGCTNQHTCPRCKKTHPMFRPCHQQGKASPSTAPQARAFKPASFPAKKD